MKPQQTRLGAYALIEDDGRILLCRLSKDVIGWEGHWTLPGGGVEFGESPEDAMRREVKEETGLDVAVQGLLGIDSLVDRSGPEHRHSVRIVYRAEIVGGILTHELTGSTDRCEWHQVETIENLKLVGLVKNVLKLRIQAP